MLQVLRFVAREVAAVVAQGVQVALVVGGGNYFRGANAWVGILTQAIPCLLPARLAGNVNDLQ